MFFLTVASDSLGSFRLLSMPSATQAVGPGLSTVVKPPGGSLETTLTPLETNEAFEEDQLQMGATQNFS